MTNDPMRTWLTRASIAAGVIFTATAEYRLAHELGASMLVAAMLPLAIDAYVVAALRWYKAFDIALSLSLMGAAQVAAHLLDAKVMAVNIPMVVVVSLLVPVSIWRTHALARHQLTDLPGEGQSDTAAVIVERQVIQGESPQPDRVIRVPEHVPHHLADKPIKGALPAPVATAPAIAPEPSAVDFLAVRHRVRPDQIRTVADLLADTPALTGTATAKALDISDRQGRRVLAAAKELTGVRS